jgi:hypothetical protein
MGGKSPKCPPTSVDVSETLARTFILIAEQQCALLEQQNQMLKALQRLVESPLTINFIAIEVDTSIRIKGNVMADQTTDASTHITGDVGALAQSGAVQFVGSITQNIQHGGAGRSPGRVSFFSHFARGRSTRTLTAECALRLIDGPAACVAHSRMYGWP